MTATGSSVEIKTPEKGLHEETESSSPSRKRPRQSENDETPVRELFSDEAKSEIERLRERNIFLQERVNLLEQ